MQPPSDMGGMSGMTDMMNSVADMAGMSGMTNMMNSVADMAGMSGMTNMMNSVADMAGMSGMTNMMAGMSGMTDTMAGMMAGMTAIKGMSPPPPPETSTAPPTTEEMSEMVPEYYDEGRQFIYAYNVSTFVTGLTFVWGVMLSLMMLSLVGYYFISTSFNNTALRRRSFNGYGEAFDGKD